MTAFIAVIPARLAATRLPTKPLLDIAGKPMVVRVAELAQRSGAQRVLVATDAPEIVQVCTAHGLEALLTSPEHPSGTDRLSEVVERLQLPDDAVLVNVQGDEPLLPPHWIAECAALLLAQADCAIATLAHPMQEAGEFHNPNMVKVVTDERSRALYFSRAPIPWPRDAALNSKAVLPEAALRHVGLYAYRAGFLRLWPGLSRPAIERLEALEQLRALAHGYAIAVLRVPHAAPGGVDTPEDLERVRAVFKAGE